MTCVRPSGTNNARFHRVVRSLLAARTEGTAVGPDCAVAFLNKNLQYESRIQDAEIETTKPNMDRDEAQSSTHGELERRASIAGAGVSGAFASALDAATTQTGFREERAALDVLKAQLVKALTAVDALHADAAFVDECVSTALDASRAHAAFFAPLSDDAAAHSAQSEDPSFFLLALHEAARQHGTVSREMLEERTILLDAAIDDLERVIQCGTRPDFA